ncbi:translation initiation factor IF-2-like isoform X3 [Vidua chalybeata]|uniref:translation initiation factor IF-2-like isoform X3 n=1 Tax=Vidua chalybeata TaxID=81927 RepID=UPI0023A8D4EF|nr:translation initiation factor IF-2-like isoform X3 [Vidua chalybeata]XP_053807320.1 translation initiation factor IF-2-like isoform X3 [Vidua chalybeata]XP_053807329.1 translation initiation factor IF-2-like isoform X3 [Vidua chalybeata]
MMTSGLWTVPGQRSVKTLRKPAVSTGYGANCGDQAAAPRGWDRARRSGAGRSRPGAAERPGLRQGAQGERPGVPAGLRARSPRVLRPGTAGGQRREAAPSRSVCGGASAPAAPSPRPAELREQRGGLRTGSSDTLKYEGLAILPRAECIDYVNAEGKKDVTLQK